jgi:hypothetical protein
MICWIIYHRILTALATFKILQSKNCLTIVLALVALCSVTGCYGPKIYRGLKPVYPELGYRYESRYPIIDTLQPVMRWTAYEDEAGITYDMCIWENPGMLVQAQPTGDAVSKLLYPNIGPSTSWGEVAYCVDRLSEPYHKVKTPLKPQTIYTWSVRIRDKEDKVSRWSHFIQHEALTGTRHSNVPYGFVTPADTPAAAQFETGEDAHKKPESISSAGGASTRGRNIYGIAGRIVSITGTAIRLGNSSVTYDASGIDISDITVGDRVSLEVLSGSSKLKSITRF